MMVVAVQILLLVGFVAAWQFAASFRLVDPFIVSQPTAIGQKFLELMNDGSLGYHVAVTAAETLIGFVLGTALGIVIAAMLWWWDFLSDVSDPYIVVLNATPKMALGPVFIIWLGATMTAVIALAISISLFVTILSVYSAFRQTDPEKLIVARSFGASKWQQFHKVVFPQAVPTIVATLKVNIGLSLIGAIVGEFLAANAGLGYLIIYGQNIFNMSLVMTSLLILTVIAGVMYYAVSLAERVFVPWQHK
ncbi:MAG: NitT/TauT family transport system permease protein [Alphaproteobacteria bacterium]|jgi:NitT/TauT family transport system permease protein|nr:NitT/TauT family transport system permease protein [Alphaproteobacteria bacterium]